MKSDAESYVTDSAFRQDILIGIGLALGFAIVMVGGCVAVAYSAGAVASLFQ